MYHKDEFPGIRTLAGAVHLAADFQQCIHRGGLVRSLKTLATVPWHTAALLSWGIALFEYLLQVPANRIGSQQAGFSVAPLKIMQEVITLTIFLPFAMVHLQQPLKMDFVWAGLCIVGRLTLFSETEDDQR